MKCIEDAEEKDIIRILRDGTGLKQLDFAKGIKMSSSSIQSYERGVRKYKFETLMKIAKNYGYIITIEKKN